MSRLADSIESVQLAMAERLLHSAESAWANRTPGIDMTGMIPHFCHALRDAVRVARSVRARLPAPEDEGDESSAAADAWLAREIAWDGADATLFEASAVSVVNDPAAVVYRWPGEARYVAAARRALRRHLHDWGMDGLADTAELVLSELGGNAARHACDLDDRLIETRFGRLPDGTLRIEVHDASDSKPELRRTTDDAESGRGLALVDALTGGLWGVSDRDGPGKTVWALIADDGTAEVPW